MHNVHLNQIEETKNKINQDPSVAKLNVDLSGEWRTDETKLQFGGMVHFPKGETLFEADFPPFLGGDGRAPTPLAYCFYGAMCCYGATFATQAAMEGVELKSLKISLNLEVDFRTALGMGEFPPINGFNFNVEVQSEASEEEIQKIKELADKRCPAIWAMENKIPYMTAAHKVN